ncbi:MAG: oligoendopeptidase F, partial [Sphaerochaetaceae bacterium]
MSADTNQRIIPERKDVALLDTWDLTVLYEDDASWEADRKNLEASIRDVSRFKGTLGNSAQALLDVLAWLEEVGQVAERVMQYAFLLHAGDGIDSANQRRRSLATQIITEFSAHTSFIEPEILAIEETTIREWLAQAEFANYRVMIEKMLRFKPHILSPEEERIMALQSEVGGKAQEAFNA